MRRVFMAILAIAFGNLLVGCDSKSNSNPRDLTQASQSELTAFYNQLSDNEVIDIFVQQNAPRCVSQFGQSGITGDLTQICQCFTKNIANGLGMSDVRKTLLPSHMIEQSEQDRLNGKMLSLMENAIYSCR